MEDTPEKSPRRMELEARAEKINVPNIDELGDEQLLQVVEDREAMHRGDTPADDGEAAAEKDSSEE